MPVGVVKRGRGRPRTTPGSASISSFTTVSKTRKLSPKKESALNAAVSAVMETPAKKTTKSAASTPAQAIPTPSSQTRKRKAAVAPVISDTEDDLIASSPSKKAPAHTIKRARRAAGSPQQRTDSPKRPSRQNQATKPQLPFHRASSTESDLSVANNTLSRLRIDSGATPTKKLSRSFGFSSSSTSATPTTSDSESGDDESCPHATTQPAGPALPEQLVDACKLFSAFLTTLSLHATYANGGAVECKALLPDVSRAWGRRQATASDIRLLLGILEHKGQHRNMLVLADYGRGKHHVEISADVMPLNVKAMRAAFEMNLHGLWRREQKNYFDATAFLAALPRANVVKKPVSRRKGKAQAQATTTLEAFKASVARKKEEEARIVKAANEAAEESKRQQQEQQQQQGGIKLSILDRVRAKETILSQLASNRESPEMAARRRALQQCPEVAAVLAMLCTSSAAPGGAMARMSFPMPKVAERLKDSLGMALSADEGLRAVRILGLEVAPEWLKVVKLGAREHVVMMRGYAPTKAEVERRVKAKLA